MREKEGARQLNLGRDYIFLLIAVALLMIASVVFATFPDIINIGSYKKEVVSFLVGLALAAVGNLVISRIQHRVGVEAANILEPQIANFGEAIDRFRQMQNFHDAGLAGVYPNRTTAMKGFKVEIERETKRIDFVGTSLLGSLDPGEEDEAKTDLHRLLLQKREFGVRIRALLMHPDYGIHRELVENRATGAVGSDIRRTLKYLLDNKNKGEKIIDGRSDIRLYTGVMTAYAIFTTRAVLINLSTLHGPVYDNCTFIFRDTDNPNSIYKNFREHHFNRPWHSEKTARLDGSEDAVDNIIAFGTQKSPSEDASSAI